MDARSPAGDKSRRTLTTVIRHRLQELPKEAQSLQNLMQKMEGGDWEHLDLLHRLADRLAGTALHLGFPYVSQLASELAQVLSACRSAREDPCPDWLPRIRPRVEVLVRAIIESMEEETPVTVKGLALRERENHLVVVTLDPTIDSRLLTQRLLAGGYSIDVVKEAKDLECTTPERQPAAVLVVGFTPGDNALLSEALVRIRESSDIAVPVIVQSLHSDLTCRIEAVRLGAHAYFASPNDQNRLLEEIRILIARSTEEPYRVVVLEEDALQGEILERALFQASIDCRVVDDPATLMENLVEFAPELLLFDVSVTAVQGLELAAAVRQLESHVAVPFAFIHTDSDLERQWIRMLQAGDDFVSKPFDLAHLIGVIRSRIARYRTLLPFIARDSLTGLLNHGRILEILDSEISRIHRHGGDLSVSMIDLDHFKKVNDTYGHPVGDRVLQSVAHLLDKRLRKTDVAGRYGGEEFAVVLPDASTASSLATLERIRKEFASMSHPSVKGSFSVTLSAGIAFYREGMTLDDFINAADRALYLAKDEGRNRIVVSGGGGDPADP